MTKNRPMFKQEKYKVTNKDWRDAFMEDIHNIDGDIQKASNSAADCIKVNRCSTCDWLKPLCAYVAQFSTGGFWYSKDKELYFVTAGVGSDDAATYEDAKAFLKAWSKR